MTSILALAALGSWTYAGFLAEPTPATPTPPPSSAPSRPVDDNPKTAPVPEPGPRQEAPPVSTATPPARYRLADAFGQVWEHADPVYLRSFVEARNRSFVRQTPQLAPPRPRARLRRRAVFPTFGPRWPGKD